MRVFLAGATGVIGSRLAPLLIAGGHVVAGMTRTAHKADALRAAGVEPVVCDVFDRAALSGSVAAFGPDVIIHQLTDLPDDPERVADLRAANARMRREGTRNLLEAARSQGIRGFVAQSVAWPIPGDGGAAVAEHERAVLDAGGLVLRYGRLHRPGTYFPGTLPPAPRLGVDEAARRTADLLDQPGGVLTVTDADGR